MQWPRLCRGHLAPLDQPGTSRPVRALRADAVELLVLAAAYVGAARLGLMLGAVNTFAAPVWPPTGIALAALLLRGTRVWPGIALGAFVANVWTGAPVLAALGIALGNTLEAAVGAYLMRRLGEFREVLDRLRHVLVLTAVASATTAISATVGGASLLLVGSISDGAFAETWRVWWLGNMVGDLVVGALLLTWCGARSSRPPERRRLAEAAAVGAAVAGAGVLIFARFPTTAGSEFLQASLLVPLLAWGALRFGVRGATATGFLVSAIAVCGTAFGRGPFVEETLSRSLLSMQAFISIVAPTLLVLGAIIDERAGALRLVEAALDEQKAARHRAELAEERAARGGPEEGRVPRDPVARAAEPPRPHSQRAPPSRPGCPARARRRAGRGPSWSARRSSSRDSSTTCST